MSEPSLKKNFALSTIYQILVLIVPFITAPYVSRVLTADGVGVYSFTHSNQMYFAMFASLGTVSYGAREIARARNDRKQRSKLFWEIELLTVFTSIVCLAGYLILIIIAKEYKIYYLILSLNIIAVMMDISWFYTGIEQLKCTVGPNVFFKVLGVIAIFTFVKTKDDLGLYILIMSLVTLLGNVTMWGYLPKYIQKVIIKDLRIKHHFKETLVYFVPTIATSVYTVLDKTLIGFITTNTSQNGYYEQATKIINIAKSLTFTSLNTLLGARISFLFAENRINEVRERIETSIDYILFMGFGICFGICGVAPRFVPFFFGEGYEPVVYLLYLLSPIVIIIGISNCLGSQYYNPAGLRALSAKFIIVGSVVNLIMNLILIPRFQSKGAVIATIVAETMITVLYMHYCNGFLKLKQIYVLGWKKCVSSILMFFVLKILDKQFLSDALAVCIEISMGIAIYCIVLFILEDTFVYKGLEIIKEKMKR